MIVYVCAHIFLFTGLIPAYLDRGVPTRTHIRMCVQLGTSSISAIEFFFWRKMKCVAKGPSSYLFKVLGTWSLKLYKI